MVYNKHLIMKELNHKSNMAIEKVAIRATRWIGSTTSLLVHTILFTISFIIYFFGVPLEEILLVLTTIVSLEAIYLSIFIQMSVNRQARKLHAVAKDVDEIQENVEDIQEDVDEIQKDVDEIQEDVEGIEKDVDEIQKDVDEIQEDVEDIQEDDEEEEKEEKKDEETLAKIEETLGRLIEEVIDLKKLHAKQSATKAKNKKGGK